MLSFCCGVIEPNPFTISVENKLYSRSTQFLLKTTKKKTTLSSVNLIFTETRRITFLVGLSVRLSGFLAGLNLTFEFD